MRGACARREPGGRLPQAATAPSPTIARRRPARSTRSRCGIPRAFATASVSNGAAIVRDPGGCLAAGAARIHRRALRRWPPRPAPDPRGAQRRSLRRRVGGRTRARLPRRRSRRSARNGHLRNRPDAAVRHRVLSARAVARVRVRGEHELGHPISVRERRHESARRAAGRRPRAPDGRPKRAIRRFHSTAGRSCLGAAPRRTWRPDTPAEINRANIPETTPHTRGCACSRPASVPRGLRSIRRPATWDVGERRDEPATCRPTSRTCSGAARGPWRIGGSQGPRARGGVERSRRHFPTFCSRTARLGPPSGGSVSAAA